MKKSILIVLALIISSLNFISAQSCPGCVINTSVWTNPGPEDLDTYPDTITVTQGAYSNEDMTFLMPLEVDPGLGIGNATVTNVKIMSVQGLPVGLSWTCDAHPTCSYNPQSYRYGCVKVCGTTFVNPGYYEVTVTIRGTGTISGVSQSQNQDVPFGLVVLPAAGGNAGFTYAPASGCDSLSVDFESQVTSPDPSLHPIDYVWDFGNGNSGTGMTVTENYIGASVYYPQLTVNNYDLYVQEMSASVSGQWWCLNIGISCTDGGSSAPDIYYNYSTTGGTSAGGSNTEIGNDLTPDWTGLNLLVDGVITLSFFDADTDADDNGGATSITVNGPGVYNFSTSGLSGTITVIDSLSSSSVFTDTVEVYQSPAATVITNISAVDTVCAGDSIILVSSLAESYYWTLNDTTFVSNDSFVVATLSGSYAVRTTQSGNSCDVLSNGYAISVLDYPPVPVIDFDGTSGLLSVTNAGNYDVNWYDDDSLVASGVDTLSIVGTGPYFAELVNNGLCATFSAPFSACVAGIANPLAVDTFGCCTGYESQLMATASGFASRSASTIVWAISSDADGPVTTDLDVQAADNDGLVFLNNPADSLDIAICDLGLSDGSYYLTPLLVDNPVVDSIPHFSADTFCLGSAFICPVINGQTGWEINSLIFGFPDGTSLDVLAQFGIPRINQAILDLLGGLPCFNLRDLFDGDPNGTWSLTATNSGTGSIDVQVPSFIYGIGADSCSFLTSDYSVQIPGVSTTLLASETKTIDLVLPPLPGDFPSVDASCEAFGTPVQFYYKDCGVGIADNTINDFELKIYPNPNQGTFQVELNNRYNEYVIIRVFDLAGQLITSKYLGKTESHYLGTITLNELQEGVYFVRVDAGQLRNTKRIIVVK